MSDKRDPGMSPGEEAPRASAFALAILFSALGLSSFGGGVSAWMHRAFVGRRAWLTEREFAAAVALARIMPGANVVNLAVVIGYRVRDAIGAIAAVLGLLGSSSVCVVLFATLYESFAGAPALHAALKGAAAAAAGLILAMAIHSGRHLIVRSLFGPRAISSLVNVAIAGGVFVFVGVLRLSTVAVVLCIAPASIFLAYADRDASESGGPDGG